MTALIVLLSISLLSLFTGVVWTLILHGQTTRRTGAQVGAEFMEEKMARQAFREGKASLARRAWFWGKGWAIEREAAFTYAEMKAMWRKGSYGAVFPMALALTSLVSSIVLGGVLLLFILDTPIPGLILMAFGVYGAWLIIGGIRRA
jgi:hypothetical protein